MDKYLKYKNLMLKGGEIKQNDVLFNINSIGFEFETDEMTILKADESFSLYRLKQKINHIPEENINIIGCVPIREKIKTINEYMDACTDIALYDSESKVFEFNKKLCRIKSNFRLEYITSPYALIYNNIFSSNGELCNTEFHFTYKEIEKNNNCIIFYLKESCKMLLSYFQELNKQKSVLINNNNNTILDKSIIYVDNLQHDNIYYLLFNNKNIDTIKWVIQVTIGIDILNIIDVCTYLSLFNTKYYKLWLESINDAETFINKFIIYYNNKFDSDINIYIIDLQILLNYLAILIYFCKFPQMNKERMTFKLRHSYRTLFHNCRNKFKNIHIKLQWSQYIKQIYNSIENDIITDYNKKFKYIECTRDDYEIKLIIYLYYFIFNKNNPESILYNDKIFKLQSNKDVFPLLNDNILIEFRSFYKFLSVYLFGYTKIRKVTLNDIISHH